MRYEWLEEWNDKGFISKEAKVRIYSNCSYIVKEATESKEALTALENKFKHLLDIMKNHSEQISNVVEDVETLSKRAPGAAPDVGKNIELLLEKSKKPMAIIGAGLTASYLLPILATAFKTHLEEKNLKKKVIENAGALQLTFKNDKDKALARFRELASISPQAASNLQLSKTLIGNNLHSGFSNETAQRLAVLQSQYTKPKAGEDFMKQISLEKSGSIAGDIYIIQSLFESEKTAGDMGRAAWLAAVPLGIGAGIGVVNVFINKHEQGKLKNSLETSYRAAFNIDKNDPIHGEKEKALKAFQALSHFAPHVAVQPEAARAFMNKLVSYDQGLMTSDIKELSEIEKNLHSVKSPGAFAEGFSASGKMVGMPKLTAGAIEEMVVKPKLPASAIEKTLS